MGISSILKDVSKLLTSTAGITIAVLAAGSIAQAQDSISLGYPASAGTGCPDGTISAVLSPDNQQLSVLFDAFVLADNEAQRGVRKNCTLAIPIHLPPGYTVQIVSADYRGFVNVPFQYKATLSSSYYFGGKRPYELKHDFLGPISENYVVSDRFQPHSPSWSNCHEDVQLNAQLSLNIQPSNEENPDAWSRGPVQGGMMATVDTMDAGAGIVYGLQWRRCDGSETAQPGTGFPGGGGRDRPGRPFPTPDVFRNVIGVIDSVNLAGRQAVIRGWACAQGTTAPIDVHVYAGGQAGQGHGVIAATANRSSEAAIEARCMSGSLTHRFEIVLNEEQTRANIGQPIFVHGISPHGLSNNLLENSGRFAIPGF